MKTVFHGKFWTVKEGEEKGEPIEKAERPPSAKVIPFTQEGKVIMLREYRPERKAQVIGLIGGKAESKDLEKEARRELAEEAGLTAKHLKLFYTTKPEEDLTWDRHFFVATGLGKTSEAKKDDDEEMEVLECTLDEACNYALSDNFRGGLMGYVLLKLRNDLQTGKFKLP